MIRPARPEDAEAVVRIFRESRAEAMPWLPVLHTPEEDLGQLSRQFDTCQAYVFEIDGRVLGFAVVKGNELDALYVAPEDQRQGVGSALFVKAQDERPNGFQFWVFRDNRRARRFYEAHGSHALHETDGAGNEERTPDVRYEWLPPVDESSQTRSGV
jgi:ribosomal protein S18 acetylase RimI-like enzyme